MPEQNYTMLFPEILDRVSKAKTKEEKVTILRENNTDSLRIVLKSSFDPKIEWVFPEGTVPYTPNDVPAGTQHTMLASEAKKLWHYIKGADNKTQQHQKELMFFQLLEGLHSSEAELICRAKDKKLHQIYEKEYCFSPIPSLAMHSTNINSVYGIPPNINWKKLWDENKV